MKIKHTLDHNEFKENFEEYKDTLIPEYLKYCLKQSKKTFKVRLPSVNTMKRHGNWSYEDVQAVLDFNEPVFKAIESLREMICFFEEFIDNTEASSVDESTKQERIAFIKEAIMQTHRIIAIYKAVIIEGR